MRLFLMFLVAMGLIWAASNPREVILSVERAADTTVGLLEAIRFTEPTRDELRRADAYERWQLNPSYDVRSLENLWKETHEYMVLLHLADAVLQGCGPTYESRVLDENQRRLLPNDFILYRQMKVRKASLCSGGVPRLSTVPRG